MNKIVEDISFELSQPSDTAQVIYSARHMLAQIGFDEVQQCLIATAVSELSTNIIRYATPGTVTLRIIHDVDRTGFEIIAVDQGPGIKNIQKALEENYSTGNGLGLGLSSVKRIMDAFEIRCEPGQGTCIITRKWME